MSGQKASVRVRFLSSFDSIPEQGKSEFGLTVWVLGMRTE